MKRSGQIPRRKPLRVRHRRRWRRDDRLAARFWRAQVVQAGCAMTGPHQGPVTGHHVIPQDYLRRNGLEAHLWDTRNGCGLCELHHAQHHSHANRLPHARLNPRVFEFAAELGILARLDRDYPEGAGGG